MKWARLHGGVAVDVRDDAPHGMFVEHIAEEFLQVPDDVADGSAFADGQWTPPPLAPIRDMAAEESDRAHNAAIDAQIAVLVAPFSPDQIAWLGRITADGVVNSVLAADAAAIDILKAKKR